MSGAGRFAGRTTLITGSTGMAASAARAIGAEGGRVFVISRTEGHARALADEAATAGHELAFSVADLTHEADVERAMASAVATYGRIDAAYNVAGISGRRLGDGPVHAATLDGWEAVLRGNLTSLFLVCRAVVGRMREQDLDGLGMRGTILNMSSVLARHPSAEHFGTHAYAASKGAIEALTRAMASTYAPDGIRVNAIAPSLVATPMSRRAQDDPDVREFLRAKQPLTGGPIDADDVTPTALHLLGPGARMITGQVIDVDAGWAVSEGG
ncbi:MAG: SDR family oxidoreductase [Chloroflexi bacterium]|nr:SDR family oxidoreductase [Chloroflexota bacterium]